jgi:hypothetical protein
VRAVIAGARAILSPMARAFRTALAEPEAAQARVRSARWAACRDTEWGARFTRFEDIPVSGWADVTPWVARQRATPAVPVLTRERVVAWEATSGSTGGAPKSVPVTPSLQASFTRAFALQAHDLLCHAGLRTLRAWITVSPRIGIARAPDGLVDDRDFLTGWVGTLARPFLVAPPGEAPDADAYWRALAVTLLAERDLSVLSAWSPTYVEALLDWMLAHRGALPRGECIGDWARLWPELRVVSAWDGGSAAPAAARLASRLGGVRLQGKGLLATEGPVTVPAWALPEAGLPLVDTVLVELRDPVRGDLRPLHAAEDGRSYEVVLSAGALVRYAPGDLVEVRGRAFATPLLRFIGRVGTSDLVGEKLGEVDVLAAFAAAGVPPGSCLVAQDGPAGGHYALEVDADEVPAGLAEAVDTALCAAHHYRLARSLGQLGGVRARAVPGRARTDMEAGAAWAGVKPRVLRALRTRIPEAP